jgi:hypothetical protein
MGKPTKRATPPRQRPARPPRIKGPIRLTDVAGEVWVSPSLEWPVGKLVDYIARAEEGGAVAWERRDDTGTHTVYRPLDAEQLATLATLRRRLHRGGGHPKGLDELGRAMRGAGIARDATAALDWLRNREREDKEKPIDRRLILKVMPNRVIRWQDSDGGIHDTPLRKRLRNL